MHWPAKREIFTYDWPHDAAASFAPVASRPYSLWLDSCRTDHPLGRFSYLCWEPFETITAKDGIVVVAGGGREDRYAAGPFQVVRERLNFWQDFFSSRFGLPPFHGGAAGMFGYDLARGIERLPEKAAPHSQPDLAIGLYDRLIAYDHLSGTARLIIHAESEASALEIRDRLAANVAASRPLEKFDPVTLDWQAARCNRDFEGDIARVIEYIRAGDIFQANLSRRFTAAVPPGFDPLPHYLNLRQINPAPYGVFMTLDGLTLAGCSPERFLSVERRAVETRPIKGTLASSFPPEMLAASEKDRAENVMIVDLLRNDLSKVCDDHSVEVTSLCEIESFAGLHHMVSTMRGRLRADETAPDLLKACFPGGSITGAPKIRAMEIIDELEPDRRGAYCGAAAWIGFNGDMDSAITIRTLVYQGGTVQLQTGGGITALSHPHAEMEETLTKAARLFESYERAPEVDT